jgi:polyhydroxyalkanoate synthesis regulator phasin
MNNLEELALKTLKFCETTEQAFIVVTNNMHSLLRRVENLEKRIKELEKKAKK